MESKLCCVLSGWTCSSCGENFGCSECNPKAWASWGKPLFTYLCDSPLNYNGCWPKYRESRYYMQGVKKDHIMSVKDWIKNRGLEAK